MVRIVTNATGECLLEVDGPSLRGALLRGCWLHYADLRDADFTRVNLSGADLTGADLSETTLSYRFDRTILVGCESFGRAQGIEAINHAGASTIDVANLRTTIAELNDQVLEAFGLTETEIGGLRELFSRVD